jgi:hypothetical protein
MRATFGTVAVTAIAAAAFFVIRSEKQIGTITASARAFDTAAREINDAVADLRSGEEAYVAAGQGVQFWIPRVTTAIERVKTGVKALQLSARTGPGRQALMEAEATVAELESIDSRVREYIDGGDRLMAADVIFSDGGNRAALTGRQLETARLAEGQTADADEAELRRRQAAALAAAAAVAGAVIVLLVPVSAREPAATLRSDDPPHVDPIARVPEPRADRDERRAPPFLKIAADLCTEFGRIRDVEDLKRQLAQAAEAMEAKGLIVWLGSMRGADLHAVVAHGYSAEAIARMPSLRRSGENAAAAAYRTGVQQIVLSRPGRMCGGIVAPILATDGCIGALSVEMPEGTEGSEGVQMLATIVAAQIAGVLADSSQSVGDLGLRMAE